MESPSLPLPTLTTGLLYKIYLGIDSDTEKTTRNPPKRLLHHLGTKILTETMRHNHSLIRIILQTDDPASAPAGDQATQY